MPKTLRAFHNNPTIQRKYVGRAFLGYELDQFRQGFYLERGDKRADDRFCAVGCILQDQFDPEDGEWEGKHEQYETLLGIPEELAHLQDRIFETLSDEDSKTWAVAFMQNIPLGADLSDVARQFALWLLTNDTFGPIHSIHESSRERAATVLCQIVNHGTTAFDSDALTGAAESLGRFQGHAAYSVYAVGGAFNDTGIDPAVLREAMSCVIGDPHSSSSKPLANACASELLRLLADAPVPAEAGV